MSPKPGITVKLVALTVVAPYLLGWILSSLVIPADYFSRPSPPVKTSIDGPSQEAETEKRRVVAKKEGDSCDDTLDAILVSEKGSDEENAFAGVSLVVHLNGDAKPCGSSTDSIDIVAALKDAASSFDYCPDQFDKFDFESFLTVVLGDHVLSSGECESPDDSEAPEGIYGYCDMGEDRTPVLTDHEHLIPIPADDEDEFSLPCHFHTREGVRITSLDQLMELSRKAQSEGTCHAGDEECPPANGELDLYAVPAGRIFMFAPSYVGEIFELNHVSVDSGLPVYLEVMSLSPRVFDVFNFFDKSESESLIEKALAETSDTHRLKRSTTGATSNSIYDKRTSESGFDTHGETAQKVKRRCMSVLGWDEYIEGHTDGLQILRYNLTKAYIPHMDYLDADRNDEGYNFDSAGVGGNRFATILLYMTDMGENDGGETVFAKGWPVGQPEEERVKLSQALKDLRESGDATELVEGSWEEEMVAQCRSRLAVRPNSARAVLFYSMNPDGTPDESSLHGGCPVLQGEKWAANLWAWSAPREGYEGAPYLDDDEPDAAPDSGPLQLSIEFVNSKRDPSTQKAELYYEDSYWGPIGHGDPTLVVNSYEGHRWNVRVDGKIVKRWTVGPEMKQFFEL